MGLFRPPFAARGNSGSYSTGQNISWTELWDEHNAYGIVSSSITVPADGVYAVHFGASLSNTETAAFFRLITGSTTQVEAGFDNQGRSSIIWVGDVDTSEPIRVQFATAGSPSSNTISDISLLIDFVGMH